MAVQSPLRGLFLILAVLVTAAMGATVIAEAAPFSFVIDYSQNVFPDSTVSVPVVKGTGADPVYGFDILIEYDAVGVTLTGVTPGPVFDIPGANEWESFSFTVDSSGRPIGLIHVVAVADINDGGHHPADYHLADDAQLFTLDFVATSDPAYECAWFPIRFYWTDCGDNALALDSLGMNLGISSQVFDWLGFYSDVTDGSYGFPGTFGAPDSCLGFPGVSREVDFYSGGLDILCTDTIDFTGDVNANGVGYEVADYIMFRNYFLNGISAFDGHVDWSRLASDINYDGNELQLEDLIYLYRVIAGDAYPPIGPFPLDTAAVTFTQDDNAKTVTLDYPDSLGALRLVFDGEITPTINISATGFSSDYNFIDGRTIAMITPSDLYGGLLEQFVVDGPILTYTGSALLIEANAADFNDRVFHTQIMSSGGDLTVPYAFEIGEIPNTAPGNIIQIPVVKTNGSEAMSGFDFLIGYDAAGLSITDVTPGEIFESLGDYQWELLDHSFGPFDCGGDCPTGLIRVIGLADTLGGSHHPLETQIPDGTTLFTLFGTVTADQTYAGLFVPARFFWIDCGVNGVAFGAIGDSLAVSDHVYDYDGVEITDRGYGLPGYYGAPDSCYANPDNPARFADFKNGGVHITSLDSMKLILSLDTVSANLGDTAVYIDVYLRNPQDSVVGFELTVATDRPDMIEFGASADDTIAFSVENTLIENWDLVAQQPLPGNRQQVGIVGISNSPPPYTNAIPPGSIGLLCRLLVHAYDSLPPFVDDSIVNLRFIDWPSQTGFSDPQGNLIGVVGQAYDSAATAFLGGYVKILVPVDGDANGDKTVNISDAVYLINYIFKSGPAPDPLEAGDANCDGNVNIADAVYLITYIFNGGPPPCTP
jgi:hypothetical protein